MSRRGRALVFGVLAIAAAAVAAAVANGYGSSIARSYGSLRAVVVARASLPARRAIDPGSLGSALEVRRVPLRFVPPGALRRPTEALGLEPRAAIPAGSYLVQSALRAPKRRRSSGPPRLADGRRPVEIEVSGAGAMLGARARSARVDVVVTSEPTGSAPGRTYVAAAGVPLLALRPGAGAGPGGTSAATLALTKRQALRLIAAENFARQVTMLPVR